MAWEQYESVGDCVANWILTLGSLPEGTSYEHKAVLLAVTKEDTKKVAAFHPEIDSDLAIIRASLEDVLRYGIQSHEIEFFKGIGGVTAERCYQEGRVIQLSDSHILRINREVIAEYDPLFSPQTAMRTRGAYAKLRGEIGDIAQSEVVIALTK